MPSIEDHPAEAGADPGRGADAGDTARRTLALRIAQRNRLRELRAERLARLRPAAAAPGAAPAGAAKDAAADASGDVSEDGDDDAEAALEEFLRALTGGSASGTVAAVPARAAVLHFQRPDRSEPPALPAAARACDLGRLPGAGPGLVGALRRAGLASLADLAPLAPEALAARLGPLGRLVPAAAWIAAARAAADPSETA